jgi:N-acetylmuramoyl-L-alanine amidase
VAFSYEDCFKLHVEGNKWKDIGYHFYITRDGEIHPGRAPNVVGAHVKGRNQNSIGICYEGYEKPMPNQISAIFTLYRMLKRDYGIGYGKWYGHYEFDSNKTCPRLPMNKFRKQLKKLEKEM